MGARGTDSSQSSQSGRPSEVNPAVRGPCQGKAEKEVSSGGCVGGGVAAGAHSPCIVATVILSPANIPLFQFFTEQYDRTVSCP
eukprot:scaffold818_cov136-Cylindrotheca_fusiformis.AAC.46